MTPVTTGGPAVTGGPCHRWPLPSRHGTESPSESEEDVGMRALETIGFSLLVIAISVGLLLFCMGGPHYRHKD